jgi:hypothetical protein
MIELIFSIVIMGIVLLSAPMLIQQSINSGNVALQQEAIVAAASQTSIILSMHWDENNNSNLAGSSPILNVGKTNLEAFYFEHNQTAGTHIEPVGLPTGITGRSTQNSTGNSPPATPLNRLGPDEANETILTQFDDVDDYHGSELNLTVFHGETTTSDIGDYVDTTIVINTTINYAEDRPTGGFLNSKDITITPSGNSGRINSTSIGGLSNIKFIHVNLTNDIEELNKSIIFDAFSCNIGTTLPQGAPH